MDIVVVGLGSMGKRRIRLIREVSHEYNVIGVDGREDRRDEAEDLFGIKCFNSIHDAYESLEKQIGKVCSFICTSPLSHSKIIEECLQYNFHVFTELNLVSDGYIENMKTAKERGLVLFLSSTFLYREEIQYIKKYISTQKVWNYIYHIGQYLPDWHPWESYKDFFIGDKRTNGCREIMAIELPWITDTFGMIEGFHVVADKMTNLSIDYNDNYIIQINHEDGNKGVLVVDVVSPYAIRHLEAYSEGKYIAWSGTPESLLEFETETGNIKKVVLSEQAEHIDGYRAFVVENAYKKEIVEFLGVVEGKDTPRYSFEKDLEILHLIDKIEGLY